MRTHSNVAVVLAFACVSCGTGEHLADCPNMPVKGWDALPQAKEFTALSHRKERVYEPLSESSQVLWADSNIAYGALLTFDLAHPRFASGAPDEKCIRDASFMALVPLEPAREAQVRAFTEFLRTHGVPAGLIYRAPEMLADPHFRAREAIVTVPHPDFGELRMQNVAPKLSETPGSVRSPSPQMGEHNDEIYLQLLGLGPERYADLKARRIILASFPDDDYVGQQAYWKTALALEAPGK